MAKTSAFAGPADFGPAVTATREFWPGERVTVKEPARGLHFILAYQYHVKIVETVPIEGGWVYYVASSDFVDDNGAPERIGPFSGHQLESGWGKRPS